MLIASAAVVRLPDVTHEPAYAIENCVPYVSDRSASAIHCDSTAAEISAGSPVADFNAQYP